MIKRLSDQQEMLVRVSHFYEDTGEIYGVKLETAAAHRTTNSLVRHGLGSIESDEQDTRFFANLDGVERVEPEMVAAWRSRRVR